jgi:predicted DNA-binding transcriptional regulator YafY
MPRNDQIIRQHYLLRALENPHGKTLQELTRAIPADYTRHARTVRRDLEALEASGVPLITEQVQGQTRWRFMDGYRNARLLNAPAQTREA